MQPLLSRIRNTFAIELTNLAIFRMALGLLVAWDLWGRYQLRFLVFGDPAATATDPVVKEGLLPVALSTEPWTDWNWSLLWLSRAVQGVREVVPLDAGSLWDQRLTTWETYLASPDFAGVFLLVGVVLALLYAAGLFTRLCNVLLWIVVLSVQVRMPLMTTGADTLTRMFLFWTMWLPMGAVLSADARFFSRQGFWRKRIHQTQAQLSEDQKRIPAGKLSISTFATAALMLQLVAMYFFSGLAKCNPHWYSGGALEEALGWLFVSRPQADMFHPMGWLLTGITYVVLALELTLPLWSFCPGLFRWTRRPAAWLLIGMHLGIAALMTIGTFSAVAIAGWILFFDRSPGSGWDWLWQDRRDTGIRLSRLLTDSPRATATARDLTVGSLLVLVLWWNVAQVPRPGMERLFPNSLRPLMHQLGLFQDFPMFAEPPKENWSWKLSAKPDSADDARSALPSPLGLPNRPGMGPDPHGEFLWRQLHVNLLFQFQQEPEFVGKIRQRLSQLERASGSQPEAPSQLWLINGKTGEATAW